MGSERVSRESEIRDHITEITERVNGELYYTADWDLTDRHACRLDRHSLLCDVTTLLAAW